MHKRHVSDMQLTGKHGMPIPRSECGWRCRGIGRCSPRTSFGTCALAASASMLCALSQVRWEACMAG